jgi:hypothetical protein
VTQYVNSATVVIRFPMRRAVCIWLLPTDGAWTVLVGNQGWSHGDRRAALADARWLARNFALPVREIEDRSRP